jgi:hypothetical protein
LNSPFKRKKQKEKKKKKKEKALPRNPSFVAAAINPHQISKGQERGGATAGRARVS